MNPLSSQVFANVKGVAASCPNCFLPTPCPWRSPGADKLGGFREVPDGSGKFQEETHADDLGRAGNPGLISFFPRAEDLAIVARRCERGHLVPDTEATALLREVLGT